MLGDSMTSSCWIMDGEITLLENRSRISRFHFPNLDLVTPFHEKVPYFIRIFDPSVFCNYQGGIKRKDLNLFEVTESIHKSSLSCKVNNKTSFKFQYILPHFVPFPVYEAEWMKEFFPNIVNQTELKLSQILQKWQRAKRIKKEKFIFSDGVTFRARELLLKYINESDYVSILPDEFDYKFERQLNPGDILLIKSPRGRIVAPKLGQASHLGFDTDDFKEENAAGKKYLETRDIRPFEFFCRMNGELYTFRNKDTLTFDKAGVIKCGINVKKKAFIQLSQVKGGVEFQTEYLNLKKSISRIPKYIANSKTRIENRIKQMNQTNTTLIQKWVERAIQEKNEESQYSLMLDEEFEFKIPLNGEILIRQGLEICGLLRKGTDSIYADIQIDKVKADYKKNYISKNLRLEKTLKTQIEFSNEKRQCFSISDKQYLEKNYLNAVLFYEP
jgi:hypothetical protein